MEQIQAILKGVMALGMLVVVGILLYACVAGGSTHGYSAPNSFTVSNGAVAHLVPDAIAGDSDATKMDGSPVVNCTAETTCTIAYTVQEPAGAPFGSSDDAADRQLVLPTRQVWKALFTDPQFQSGTISVSGPVSTIGGKSKTDLFYTLSCDRGAASQIDWDRVEGNGLRTLCDYHADVKGLPGYTGQTTPSGDAAGERQFQADIQAHGVPDSIAAVPDLGDGACNSVKNGQAPGVWAMQMTNPPNNFTIMQSLVIVYWAIKDLCPNQMDKGVQDFWQNEIYDHPPGIEPTTPDTGPPLEPGQ